MPRPLLHDERSLTSPASRLDQWCQKFRHQVALMAVAVILLCFFCIVLLTMA